jgi:hypothetical protein
VTQTTPSNEDGGTTVLITGINTRYYRFAGMQIQKSKFLWISSCGNLMCPAAAWRVQSFRYKEKQWTRTQDLWSQSHPAIPERVGRTFRVGSKSAQLPPRRPWRADWQRPGSTGKRSRVSRMRNKSPRIPISECQKREQPTRTEIAVGQRGHQSLCASSVIRVTRLLFI